MATIPRVKLTELAIADVKKATTAKLVKSKGGYRVDVCNEHASERLLDKLGRAVIYSSKDNAKRTLNRHNPALKVEIKSRLEE